jgi:hypothetical protein
MGWYDATTRGVKFDGTADFMAHSAAAANFKFLHDGSPFTAWNVYTPASLAANCAVRSTSSGVANDVGQFLRVETTGAFRLAIGNGAAYVVDATTVGALAAVGVPSLAVARYAGSGNVEAWIAGVKRIDAAPVGVPSAANPIGYAIGTLNVGGAVAPANGTFGGLGLIQGTISDADLAKLGKYYRGANPGLVWA